VDGAADIPGAQMMVPRRTIGRAPGRKRVEIARFSAVRGKTALLRLDTAACCGYPIRPPLCGNPPPTGWR